MDGLWKTLLKWMIWGYHYFRKHPYGNIWYKSHWVSGPCLISGFCSTFLHSFGRLGIQRGDIGGEKSPEFGAGQGDQTKGIGPSLNIRHFYRFTQLLCCRILQIPCVDSCRVNLRDFKQLRGWRWCLEIYFSYNVQSHAKKRSRNHTQQNIQKQKILKMYHPTDVNER